MRIFKSLTCNVYVHFANPVLTGAGIDESSRICCKVLLGDLPLPSCTGSHSCPVVSGRRRIPDSSGSAGCLGMLTHTRVHDGPAADLMRADVHTDVDIAVEAVRCISAGQLGGHGAGQGQN